MAIQASPALAQQPGISPCPASTPYDAPGKEPLTLEQLRTLKIALACAVASLYSVCAMRGVYLFSPATIDKALEHLKGREEDGRRVAVISEAIRWL